MTVLSGWPLSFEEIDHAEDLFSHGPARRAKYICFFFFPVKPKVLLSNHHNIDI